MKKKNLTLEQQLAIYKKRFTFVSILSFVIIALLLFYIYLNYNFLAFKHLISNHYMYTKTLDDLFRKELGIDANGKYYLYFDNLAISIITKRIREENNDRYTYLYTPQALKKSMQEEKEDALKSELKILNEKTVYMRLTNFSKYTKDFVLNNIAILQKHPFIIIDLRDNYGGDVFAMAAMADVFLPKGKIIAVDRMRMFNWTYKSKKDQKLKFNKIIILQNKNTASAAENFTVSLKDNLENVLTIGEKTFGKGIGQFTLPLRQGYAVKATVMKWFSPKNYNIHGVGIAPDIFYTGEDIIDFSLKQLP